MNSRIWRLGAALALLAACTSEPEIPERGPASKLDESTLGTVRGTVVFDGTPPRPGTILVAGDPNCKRKDLAAAANVQVVDGKISNAFVYVKEGLEQLVFERPTGAIEIDQDGCLYRPHVVGVQTGQTLRFRNSDPTLHNVHTHSDNSRNVNFGMPLQNDTRDIRLAKAEIMVGVKCDVHPWMRAWVGVLDHPYFAVTGADGTFKVSRIPPGEYLIEAWHERFGTVSEKVMLPASGEVATELRFSGQ